MNIRQLAPAAAVAAALAVASPAVAPEAGSAAPPSPCPDGFIPALDPFNVSGEDRNDNDVVCVKTTGGGDIFKDDRVG
jgi:hypothetical protein